MRQRIQWFRDAWSQLSPSEVLLAALLCLAMALAAQQSLDRRIAKPAALLVFGLAAAFLAMLTARTAAEAQTDNAQDRLPVAPSVSTLVALLALSLLGCLDLGGNEFRLFGAVLWGGGVLLTLLYLWIISARGTWGQRVTAAWRSRTLSVPWHWLAMVAILLAGAWLRLRLLNDIPADMGWDLPYNYFDSLTILQGKYPIFFPANLGRESMFFYWIALCARFIGLEQFTLQLASALVGIATIVPLYWLGREAMDRQVGLVAALLLAVNRWHIVLSRSGFRVILMPLFTILVLYTLVRALRRRQFVDWGWAGVALGLGCYTYKSFLFVPLALAGGLLLYLIAHRSEARSMLGGLLLMACLALVVAAPLGRYALEKPKEYFAREQRQIEVMRRQQQQEGIASYYWRSLLGFNYEGDANTRFNVPFRRHMGLVSGALMVLGLGYMLIRWRHGYNSLFLAAWFVLVLPTALTMQPKEPPNVFRMSGTIGPALLMAALPVLLIARRMREATSTETSGSSQPCDGGVQTGPAAAHEGLCISLAVDSPTRHYAWSWRPQWVHLARLALTVAALWLLAREAGETHRFIFHDYVEVLPDRANYSIAREMAREIENYGAVPSAFIKVWPHWYDGNAVRVRLRQPDNRWNPDVMTLAPDQPPLSTIEGSALIIVHPDDREAMATLNDYFPRGIVIPRYYPDGGLSFYAFYGQR